MNSHVFSSFDVVVLLFHLCQLSNVRSIPQHFNSKHGQGHCHHNSIHNPHKSIREHQRMNSNHNRWNPISCFFFLSEDQTRKTKQNRPYKTETNRPPGAEKGRFDVSAENLIFTKEANTPTKLNTRANKNICTIESNEIAVKPWKHTRQKNHKHKHKNPTKRTKMNSDVEMIAMTGSFR
jgi:hypothetical protein